MSAPLESLDEVKLAFRKNTCKDREVFRLNAGWQLAGGQTAPFNPTAWATISAVAGASPVTIAVRTPSPFNSEIREIESVRGGSLRAINPMIWLDAAGPVATAKTRKPCFSSSSAIAAAAGEGAVRATTAVNAPLIIRSELPAGSVAVASEVFLTGSNGTKTASFGKPVAVFCDAASRMAASTGSWPLRNSPAPPFRERGLRRILVMGARLRQ